MENKDLAFWLAAASHVAAFKGNKEDSRKLMLAAQRIQALADAEKDFGPATLRLVQEPKEPAHDPR